MITGGILLALLSVGSWLARRHEASKPKPEELPE